MMVRRRGNTVGITLRISADVLAAYTDIAKRANLMSLYSGAPANLTVQDVIRHRLTSLPVVSGRVKKKRVSADEN